MEKRGGIGDKMYVSKQKYARGHDAQAAQKQYVTEAGSQIVGSDLHDLLKVQDFSPYISKVKSAGAQTILTGNWGNDIVLLLRAVGESGPKIRIGNQSLDTPGTLAAAGDAAEGAYLAKLYNLEAGGDAGKAFIEDFKKYMGHYPSSEEPTTAFAFLLLGEALKT